MFTSNKSRRNVITQIDKREARGTIFAKAILIITEYIEVIEIIYDTVINLWHGYKLFAPNTLRSKVELK